MTVDFSYIWYKIANFYEDWVYPAYSLQNLLIHRYDLVRLPLKRTDYCDDDERMYLANMELVRHFIEKCDWQRFAWYPEDGGEGIRYGMDPENRPFFPEYKGRYVIDMIKEIYEWHIHGLAKMEKKKGKHIWGKIERQKQKYLHLCIEVRPYLWT